MNSTKPAASVIIPLWNGAALIENCLDHLLGSRLPVAAPLDVLVVDNGSVDNGVRLVQSKYPTVRLIQNGRNLGFAGGCNVGIAAAQSDQLVLLNQDTAVDPDWLANLLDSLNDATVGVAGGLALFPGGEIVQHAGVEVDLPLAVARHRGYQEPLAQEWLQQRDVVAVTGAGLAIRRAVLEQCGGLDEAFWPGYYEDIDLCYRVRGQGYRVCYVPGARLIHQESSSFTEKVVASWARLRGRLRFVLKHLPPEQILHEFLPAEQTYRATVLAGDQAGFIARAYLEAIPMVLSLHGGQSRHWLSAVCEHLATLYGPPEIAPAARGRSQSAVEPVIVPGPADRMPLLGPLLKRARRSLHQLIIFYARRQQESMRAEIESQQAHIRRLERMLANQEP